MTPTANDEATREVLRTYHRVRVQRIWPFVVGYGVWLLWEWAKAWPTLEHVLEALR